MFVSDDVFYLFLIACSQTVFIAQCVKAPLKDLNIGVLLHDHDDNPQKALYIKATTKLASVALQPIVEEIGYKLNFEYANSGCTEVLSVGSAAKLINQKNVRALMGPVCSVGCVPAGLIATYENVPMLSFGCSTSAMSNKEDYPTFARTRPFARTVPRYLKNVVHNSLKKFNWEHIGIVYATGSKWLAAYQEVVKAIDKSNHTTMWPRIPFDAYEEELNLAVEQLKQQSRVIMLLIASEDIAKFLSLTYAHGMHEGEYAFISLDFSYSSKWEKKEWFAGPQIFEGMLNVGVKSALGMSNEEELNLFKTDLFFNLVKMGHNPVTENLTYYEGSTYLYDALLSYVQAANLKVKDVKKTRRAYFLNDTKIDQFLLLNNLSDVDTLDAINHNLSFHVNSTWSNYNWTYPLNWTHTNFTLPVMNYTYEEDFDTDDVLMDGIGVMEFIFNSNFKGSSGEVHLNDKGDRIPVLKYDNLVVNQEGEIEYMRTFEHNEYYNLFTDFTVGRKVVWPGGGTDVPLSVPVCGFSGEFCEDQPLEISDIVLACLSPFIAMAVGFFVYRMYRQKQYEKDLLNQEMIFKFPEIEIPILIAKQTSEEIKKKAELKKIKKKARMVELNEHEDDTSSMKELIVADNTTRETMKSDRMRRNTFFQDDVLRPLGNFNKRNLCQNFKGKLFMEHVLIKRLPKSQVVVNREILVEMKEIRDLKHHNLNPYVGFCVGPPYVLICSSFCNKGTLQDVILNPDIQIDWVFRNTFITDIIAGLVAIHESPIGCHGHLTSNNILIDNRWNCKITDYGLFKFRDLTHELKALELDEDGKYEALLWTSPENINFPFPRISKEGDIYALGIVISEIINRALPFCSYAEYTARDFIHFIHKRCIPPFRPHVRLQAGLDGRTLDLMRTCWDEYPENRPTIQFIKSAFKNIFKDQGESKNLLDNMIEMMEKYAHNLEMDCNERTRELEQERVKSDKLFYRALPKYIPLYTELFSLYQVGSEGETNILRAQYSLDPRLSLLTQYRENRSIADQIRKGEEVESRSISSATVLIFKVDDFNYFIENLEPHQVIDLLHDVHKVVDIALEEEQDRCHLLQFNRDTCGIVCGMPEPIKVKHASYIAKTAVRIMGQLREFRFRHIKDEDMRFKIAIHSGQFICGIVGLKFPVFQCMGYEVERAHAMCSITPPLKIFVSPDTKKLLDKCLKSGSFDKTGPLLLKNYGVVDGFYLKSIRSLGIKMRDPNTVKPRAVKKPGDYSLKVVQAVGILKK